MAVSITSVTGSPSKGVSIAITGMTSTLYYVLYRTVASGHYPATRVQEVDGTLWDFYLYGSSSKTVVDYSLPLRETITYHLEGYSGGDFVNLLESDTEVLSAVPGEDLEAPGLAIITDPLSLNTAYTVDFPYNVTGTVTDFQKTSRSARVLGTHYVLGRKNPIVVSDGLKERTGSFSIVNLSTIATAVGGETQSANHDIISRNEVDGWPVLFEDGQTLLFRSYWKETGIDDFYFKPTSVDVERIQRMVTNYAPASQMPVIYTVQFQEVDPFVLLDPQDIAPTWQAVLDANATWAEVLAAHATWADVLANPGA